MAREPDVTAGPGYSVSSIDRLGESYGFRKIRVPMGVTAFGVNAVVLPPDYPTRNHSHETQEELYFVHRGSVDVTFGDGTTHRVDEGGLVWVAPATVRQLKNVGETDVVLLAVGGKDGYVPRDGQPAPGGHRKPAA